MTTRNPARCPLLDADLDVEELEHRIELAAATGGGLQGNDACDWGLIKCPEPGPDIPPDVPTKSPS